MAPPHRPELGPCLMWTASVRKDGYGRFGINGKIEKANRVAFFLSNGRWPKDHACHHCDERLCVRGDHLFDGDNFVNMRDCVAKGRSGSQRHPGIRKGERNGCAKLTETEVRAILASNETANALAQRHGISTTAVRLIRNRESWKHVA